VTSKAYVEREWTQRELKAFCEGINHLDRLFPVEYRPLRSGAEFPMPLSSVKATRFWSADVQYGVETPLQIGDRDYRMRANLLSVKLADQLSRMRLKAGAPEAKNKLGGTSVYNQDIKNLESALASSEGSLVVGRTAPDMDIEAQRLVTYFRGLGYSVADAADLRQGGNDFKSDLSAALKSAKVFLLPIGISAGRRPPDLSEGYYAAQIAVAKASGAQVILWRRPTVSVVEAETPEHALLLDSEDVTVATYQNLIVQIREALQAAKTESVNPIPSSVFVNATGEDRHEALRLVEELADRGIYAFVPELDQDSSENRKVLQTCLTNCEKVLLLYGSVGLSWVHGQVLQMSRLRSRMEATNKGVLIGPPDDKPTEIGFRANDIEVVDVMPNWDREKIFAWVGA